MKCFFYLLILVFTTVVVRAQSVAINTTGAAANNSAILDVSSFSKGVLVPRMTKAQKNAIATPALGLLVFQGAPDSIGFHYYNGSAWVWINPSGAAGNDWSLTGNIGTDTAANFIGTTDNMPIRFKQNNIWLGQLNRNNDSYFIGELSGKNNTAGARLTGFGDSALFSNTTGADNVAVGNRSLVKNTTGERNVALGSAALRSNTFASFGIAVGYHALQSNISGDENIAVGDQALEANTSGLRNNAIGSSALQFNTTGSENTAMGTYALINNTSGQANTAIGYSAAFANATGDYNVAVGDSALRQNVTGDNNIAIGRASVFNNQSSSGLIGIGRNALQTVTNSSNLIAIGDSALFDNTTAVKNIALGNKALLNTTTGSQNTAIGNNTLKSNIVGFANVAIGDSALSANTTNWNIAIGRNALTETTTGDKNIAIGDGALFNNQTGINNVAVGYAAQNQATTNNKNNTSLGYRSMISMQGYSNTALGGDVMGKPAVTYTVNNVVAVGDSALFNIATGANGNTALGSKALYTNTSGHSNTAIGIMAMHDNTTGNNSVAVGDSAAFNSTASNNVAIGSKAMWNNTAGTGNTVIGYNSLLNSTIGGGNATLGFNTLLSNIAGSANTAIGNLAGFSNQGSGNVFLGYSAGFNETGSNKLYIDNSVTVSPLVYGDFTTNLLRVNGTLDINNNYTFPTIDGAANQVLYTNGAGTVNWGNAVFAANNGLNVVSGFTKLGGLLIDSTTITQANKSLVFDLNGTGNFYVRKNTTDDAFMVKNGNGYVGLNTSDPQYRLHIVNLAGGNGPFGRGIVIENSNALLNGEATIAFKNNGPGSVPANSAWMTGLNNATNFVIAYGDSLIASRVKMKVDTLGNVSVGNQGSAAQSKLDINGSFGNAIRTTNINTTLDVDDHTVMIGNAAPAISITLPVATSCDRREYVIVNRSGLAQTVTSYFDFSGTSTTIAANSAITLQSNGSNWFRIR